MIKLFKWQKNYYLNFVQYILYFIIFSSLTCVYASFDTFSRAEQNKENFFFESEIMEVKANSEEVDDDPQVIVPKS